MVTDPSSGVGYDTNVTTYNVATILILAAEMFVLEGWTVTVCGDGTGLETIDVAAVASEVVGVGSEVTESLTGEVEHSVGYVLGTVLDMRECSWC